MIFETAHVTRRHSTDPERFLVCLGEPTGEFPQVLPERSSGVWTEIVLIQEAVDEDRFLVADGNGFRITIGGIFHGLCPRIRKEVDSECVQLDR